MKKVLIITDLFHASPRMPGLCKYLKEFGWEPALLTTPIGEDPEWGFRHAIATKNQNRYPISTWIIARK